MSQQHAKKQPRLSKVKTQNCNSRVAQLPSRIRDFVIGCPLLFPCLVVVSYASPDRVPQGRYHGGHCVATGRPDALPAAPLELRGHSRRRKTGKRGCRGRVLDCRVVSYTAVPISFSCPTSLSQRNSGVRPTAINQVVDRSKDPSYYGDVQIMIFNVPLKTITESTEVNQTRKHKTSQHWKL